MEHSVVDNFVHGFKRSSKLVVAILLIGFAGAGVAVVKVHTKYIAGANILAVDNSANTDSSQQVSNGARNPVVLADLPALAMSSTVLRNASLDLHGRLEPQDLAAGVRAGIGGGSSILHISFVSKKPADAVDAVNAIAHEIAMYVRTVSTNRYDALIKDLTGQLSVLRIRLEALDTQLDAQAKAYPFVDVKSASGGDGTSVYGRLTQLRAQQEDAEAAVAADQSTMQASAKLLDNAKPVAERDLVESDPAYKNLSDQYAKDNQELQHVQSFGNTSYPGLTELKETVQSEASALVELRKKLVAKNLSGNSSYAAANDAITHSNAVLQADQAKLDAIKGDRAKLESDIGDGSIASEVARIRRDRDDTDDAYRAIATKLSQAEADRAQAAATGALMIMDHARAASAQPLSSGKYMALGIIFLTLWVAVSIIFLLNKPATRRPLHAAFPYSGPGPRLPNVSHEELPPITTVER
jgi:capsular polysaccharide biosynthesis protein